ncbi:hypothetical protein K503DRAFT_768771 [Rhizopogon vinicolor AM-OR11-026]|uniref:Pali-domain-containing protein n=1 Tax=Rhizopogon vinicolor AM-OR11-026 TaxID=1314800 RepID=A0A1B7N5S1_9AGAM|nr:hypothetical protein K503DRAFT_768771 [Rhizopogon vinicolor AM-OR11-026]
MNIIIRLVSFTLLLTVFLLFLLVGLSLTIIKSIIIIEVSAVNSIDPVSNAVTKLQFGVWGVCTTSILNSATAQRACFGPQLGYTIPTSLLSLVGLSSELADVAETTLLTLLVLHLVCAGLSVVDFILTLLLHSRPATIIALVVAVITAVLSTVVFAVDVALLVVVRNNINSLFSGGDFVVSFGNGAWMILVAMILAWLLVTMLSAQRYYFCGVRRPKPESNTSEKDSIEKVTIEDEQSCPVVHAVHV